MATPNLGAGLNYPPEVTVSNGFEGGKTIRLLADATNRSVLSVLNDTAQELSVSNLADRILARDLLSTSSDYVEEMTETS